MPIHSFNTSMIENLKVPVWIRRSPWINFERPLWGARLGVVLSEKVDRHTEEYKVLQGMLSVLSLHQNEYWVGWKKEHASMEEAGLLLDEMQKWAPKNILILGEPLKFLIEQTEQKERNEEGKAQNFPRNIVFYSSFHPKELVKNNQHKRSAYQDLLRLKERLR